MFAERRQAQVSPSTLLIYSKDLAAFELDDIEEALEKFGKSIPEKFDLAFPCIGVFIAKVESVVNRRKREERERKAALEEQERVRLREEEYLLDPERYAREDREFQERTQALNKKLGIPNNVRPK